MDGKHYKLSILPLFEDDLNEIVDYISVRLQNQIAAEDFVDAVENAIQDRLSCAEAFELPLCERAQVSLLPNPSQELYHLLCSDWRHDRSTPYRL